MENTPGVNSISELQRLSRVSNSSFRHSFSMNSSAEVSFKRKLREDDDDTDGSMAKRDSRIGSPLMSPWEFRKIRADLADSQNQIIRLEDRIDQLHKKNKEQVIFFDQEKAEMKVQIDTSRKTIEKLEKKIQKMRAQDVEHKADMYDVQRLLEKNVLDRDQKIEQLRNNIAQLRLELSEVDHHSDRTETDLKREVDELKMKLFKFQSEADANRDILESTEARLAVALEDAREKELMEIEMRKANERIKELEDEKEEMEESRAVTTSLKSQVFKLVEVREELKRSQEEVSNLKLAVHNKVMMEEKMHSMEMKMAAMDEREKEFIALKEQAFDLQTELERWTAMVVKCCGGNSRDDLQAYITQIQDNDIKNSEETNSLNAKIAELTAKLQSTAEMLAAAKKGEDNMKTLMEKQKTEVQLLRRKVALVTRERDSYRQQLDMFEKDLTVSGGLGGGTGSPERVQELEGILEGYREQMKSLEQQLTLYKGDDAEARLTASKKLEQELNNARAECERLSARRDELEAMLEERVRSGTYPSPNTKVLHFRNNPLAQAEEKQTADVAELRDECDRLKARIRLLEAGERLDLTVRAAVDVESGAAARVRELEEQLESAMLKNTRLKEVFKRTSQDFRDVSYMLLGYRIDLVSNKVYRLTNMYSDDPEDHFMFQLNRSGMMEMLETAYTQRFQELVKIQLLENNSIPCFLSAVTLNLHSAEEASSPPREVDEEMEEGAEEFGSEEGGGEEMGSEREESGNEREELGREGEEGDESGSEGEEVGESEREGEEGDESGSEGDERGESESEEEEGDEGDSEDDGEGGDDAVIDISD